MEKPEPRQICGIVMPISAIDGCSEGHWDEVQNIVRSSIEDADFVANLVSNADEVGIIQKTIIQNLYDNPVVVCDTSGKNPNVMFELGMRLAFDKPTIIIKDDKTTYTFDTAPIEHLEYPRDLRFSKIVDFKKKLTEKIKATYEKSTNDQSYTTFLKNFGEFKVAKIEQKEVPSQEIVIDELKYIRNLLRKMERYPYGKYAPAMKPYESDIHRPWDLDYCAETKTADEVDFIVAYLKAHEDVLVVEVQDRGGHAHIRALVMGGAERGLQIKKMISNNFDLNRPHPKLKKNSH